MVFDVQPLAALAPSPYTGSGSPSNAFVMNSGRTSRILARAVGIGAAGDQRVGA